MSLKRQRERQRLTDKCMAMVLQSYAMPTLGMASAVHIYIECLSYLLNLQRNFLNSNPLSNSSVALADESAHDWRSQKEMVRNMSTKADKGAHIELQDRAKYKPNLLAIY